MGVENAACPHCGKQALVTVPSGQIFIRVIRTRLSAQDRYNCQHCVCPNCGSRFFAETADMDE